MMDSITHTIRKVKKWVKPVKVKTQMALLGSKSVIIPEPYGSVLIIGPFNYPFQLLIEPLVGAIAAGNTAVLKASENTPAVSAVVREMIATVFEPAYVQVLDGAKDTTTALINAPFDYIFFTGSVPVGKIVMEAAAKILFPLRWSWAARVRSSWMNRRISSSCPAYYMGQTAQYRTDLYRTRLFACA